jgi:hypothetical protein
MKLGQQKLQIIYGFFFVRNEKTLITKSNHESVNIFYSFALLTQKKIIP